MANASPDSKILGGIPFAAGEGAGHEVTDMTDDQKKVLAEKYIAQSRRSELHTCDSPESACDGCEMMNKGLRMLAEIGDPTVYRV